MCVERSDSVELTGLAEDVEELDFDPAVVLDEADDLGLVGPFVVLGGPVVCGADCGVLDHEAVVVILVPFGVVEESDVEVVALESSALVGLLDDLHPHLDLEPFHHIVDGGLENILRYLFNLFRDFLIGLTWQLFNRLVTEV